MVMIIVINVHSYIIVVSVAILLHVYCTAGFIPCYSYKHSLILQDLYFRSVL